MIKIIFFYFINKIIYLYIMISICVPVYNSSEFLEKCITSILNQSYKNFELIIQDDASTDNSFEIINTYKDPRIKIMKNEKNIGWVNNCNSLISQTIYDYYCIICSDDYIPINYIEELYNTIIKDELIINCYPYIISFGNHTIPTRQKSINDDNISLRIEDFITNHHNAVSFRGLVKKSSKLNLLYLEQLNNNMWSDSLQILQHVIEGKLIEVNIEYYKRYHENNTHTKWKSTTNDYINYYLTIYILSKNFIEKDKLINIIDKRLFRYKIYNFKEIKNNYYDYIIMGGGLQGCCFALYLKKHGKEVCIIEKNNQLLQEASGNNEGKIHLGFVYSNDPSLQTGEKMLIDALNFSSSIEYLIGKKINWQSIKSKKFIYLVPKTSIITEKELDIYFSKLQTKYTELLIQNPKLNYLGERPQEIYKKIDIPDNFNKEYFTCCYQTVEYAIDIKILNQLIIDNLKNNEIPIILNNTIEEIKKSNNFFLIKTNKNNFYSEKLINCLWSSKTKIDNFILEKKTFNTNYRYKFGIISDYINSLSNQYSITIVNGQFGDFVNFSNYMYFSWYPYSVLGFCCSTQAPSEWNTYNLINDKNNFINLHKDIFNFLFKQNFDFQNPKIIGGVIVAKGIQDIINPKSKLHKRNEKRIKMKNNYFSISTGKYTSAPYNSLLLSEYIL